MSQLNLKPTHAAVKGYYDVLGQLGQLHIDHEMAVRSAFQTVLTGSPTSSSGPSSPNIHPSMPRVIAFVVDGAVLDFWKLRHGFWEAKDENDDLEREIKSKIDKGYPTNNIIFQAPDRAILYQNGVRQGLNEDISRPEEPRRALLNEFFAYREPAHRGMGSSRRRVHSASPRSPSAAKRLIDESARRNRAFVERFDDFYALCRQAINPNLSDDAVEEMLIQHLLTERIFRKIFDNPDFRQPQRHRRRNREGHRRPDHRHFSRDDFLNQARPLLRGHRSAPPTTSTDFSEKQNFLNTVYERFFQGFSVKVADTHGIVYTPQPIVDFMVRSVEDILQEGVRHARSATQASTSSTPSSAPATSSSTSCGEIPKPPALPHKYAHELHCNEVMLLPYYIACMNIEHAYFEQTGEYKPFRGHLPGGHLRTGGSRADQLRASCRGEHRAR